MVAHPRSGVPLSNSTFGDSTLGSGIWELAIVGIFTPRLLAKATSQSFGCQPPGRTAPPAQPAPCRSTPRPSQACSFHFQQPGQGQAGSDESAQRGYRKVWAALSACPADDAELSGRVSLCSTAPLTQGFRPWAGSGRPGPVNGGRGRIPTRAGKGRGALLLSKQPPVPGGRRLCRASL